MLYALLVLMLLLLLLLLLLDPFKPGLVNPGVLLLWLLLLRNVNVHLVTFADGLLQLHNLIWLLHLSHSEVPRLLISLLFTLDLFDLRVVQLATLRIPLQDLFI